MAEDLPDFDEATGYLPDGEWTTPWALFVEHFGWNHHRRQLIQKLASGLIVVRKAGANCAWINGSFTTTKEYPADVDVLYSARGVRPTHLPDDFKDKKQRKLIYGGDYFAVDDSNRMTAEPDGLFAAFRTDRGGGIPKGVVFLSLRTVTMESPSQ